MINDLLKLAKKYKNVVFLNVDSFNESKFDALKKFFPDRCFSFGLAEGNMMSAASGFALMGKMPVILGNGVSIFSNAYSQIRDEVCNMNLNVKIIDMECGLDPILDDVSERFPNMNVFSISEEEPFYDVLEKMVLSYGPVFLS